MIDETYWKKLLSLRLYRTQIAVFILSGAFLVAISRFVASDVWRELIFQFGITFAAVGLVSVLWDFLGGGFEQRVLENLSTVSHRVDELNQSLPVSSDRGALGIERMWATRREWDADAKDGLAVWKTRLCNASEVDVVSSTFWSWMTDESFSAAFFKNLDRGATARIVLYHPLSRAVEERTLDEPPTAPGQMANEIMSTLGRFAECRSRMSHPENMQVGLTPRFFHFAQIIRADEQMLIANYLSGKSGTPSPTTQLRGGKTPHSVTYRNQIDLLWKRCQKLNEGDFANILEHEMPEVKFQDVPGKG